MNFICLLFQFIYLFICNYISIDLQNNNPTSEIGYKKCVHLYIPEFIYLFVFQICLFM